MTFVNVESEAVYEDGLARIPREQALALMGDGKIDVKPLLTDTFDFADSVAAFDYASHLPPTSVKAQITVS